MLDNIGLAEEDRALSMSEMPDDITRIHVDSFEHETDLALLFMIDGDEVWIPKSVVVDWDDDFVDLPTWWAEKEGLE